ncbi:hypothetical protein RclHR1_10190008 [Rhizophagus clarus]|uniref:Kinase-like domain-containing protein n=1 Tax=Rhizophagus clarus TaxID=94130 RepID=A0A2Z6QCP1_9GLOM|nr:hypothetical protein RclHR1_10190008 [Rhizophagus clarus]GES98913.1 kinase-like domain-containing protein [Rhizophagus clarus]
MDKFIFEKKLKWIRYSKLKNVEYLSKGGFGIIYKAIWSNEDGNKEVILKCLNDSNEDLNDLNEWKYHESCMNSFEIVYLHGFTKKPDTSSYMMVMDYANQGNLRGNLQTIVNFGWRNKLYMLYKVISGLNEIHVQNLVHCDFHDGNILNHKERDDLAGVYISDLGLCRPTKSRIKKDDLFGVIPFMAPEILRAHDLQLSLDICKGVRPKIIENTPQCYVDLMEKCWSEDQSKRPSALEIRITIENWVLRRNEESKNDALEFINAPAGDFSNLITEFHPETCYTSRLHDFTSSKVNEILSENLNEIPENLNEISSENFDKVLSENLNDCLVDN